MSSREILEEHENLLHGSRRLQADDIFLSGDVCPDNSKLNFYVETNFDVDAVFGTHVCTDENDDYLNVYADYDLENRCVCDTLGVILVGCDTDIDYTYILSDGEKAMLLPKMEAYCFLETGQTLEEWREQYLSEEQSLSGQTM